MTVFSRMAVPASKLLRNGVNGFKNQIRHSGDSHWDSNMNIIASRWTYIRFKDMLHFYVVLFSVPLLAVITYANIFVGTSKLAPIPEGYEPEEHEYEPHPITRWLVKNVYISEQELYERRLHQIWEDTREMHRNELRKEVHRQMALEGDYAAWYYSPTQARYTRMWKKEREDEKRSAGSF